MDTEPHTLRGGRIGVLALVISAVGNSLSSLLYKISFLTGLSPLWVNFIRLGLTLLLMAPLTLFDRQKRESLRGAPKDVFWVSALSGVLLALHFTCWVFALQNTDVFAATAIWGTYLLMTTLLSSLLLREKTSSGALIGLLIATAGVIVCNVGGGESKLTGNLLAFAAALMQALYTLCGRKARQKTDAFTYTSIVYFFTFLCMGLSLLVFQASPTGFSAQSLLGALGLAVFCTLLGHSMASVALKFFKAPTVSAVLLSACVTGPLMVYLFLGESPSRSTLIGGAIILIGLVW